MFDPVSGEFKCVVCEYDYTWTGVGQVKMDETNVYLSHVSDDLRLSVSLEVISHAGKVSMESVHPSGAAFTPAPITENWSDSDMRNNLMGCGAAKGKKHRRQVLAHKRGRGVWRPRPRTASWVNPRPALSNFSQPARRLIS